MLVFPNAKINIGLQIVGRRADGYHDLLTVFHPLPWRDALEIVAAPDRAPGDHRLTVTGNAVDCPPERNLVMRAVRAIEGYAGLPSAVDVHLHKIIPDGAGLGGGSADASFALTALNEMFGLGLTGAELAGLAGEIGADCPYFIYGGTMVAEGTGDILTAVRPGPDLSGWHVLTVKPSVKVSTAEAFRGVTPRGEADRGMVEAVLTLPPDRWRGRVVNDFEPSVFAAHPELARIKQGLYDAGAAYASLSGSGSAIFALFPREVTVEALPLSTEWLDELFIS